MVNQYVNYARIVILERDLLNNFTNFCVIFMLGDYNEKG